LPGQLSQMGVRMKTNDILRRIRYVLNLNDGAVIDLFTQGGRPVKQVQIITWLRKDDDPEYQLCPDVMFAAFLNGLIIAKRGPRQGQQPVPESKLNNNLVLRKLKIAFNLQTEDMQRVLKLANTEVSQHELSAFFRRADHKHYRACKDQILRNFLSGLQRQLRGT